MPFICYPTVDIRAPFHLPNHSPFAFRGPNKAQLGFNTPNLFLRPLGNTDSIWDNFGWDWRAAVAERPRGHCPNRIRVRAVCCSALPASALLPAQIRPCPHRRLPSFFLSLRRRRPSSSHISAADLALLASTTSRAQLHLHSCVCFTFVRFGIIRQTTTGILSISTSIAELNKHLLSIFNSLHGPNNQNKLS